MADRLYWVCLDTGMVKAGEPINEETSQTWVQTPQPYELSAYMQKVWEELEQYRD